MPDWIKKYVGREITDSNRAMIQAEAYEEHAKAVEFALQMGEPITQDVIRDHGALQRQYGYDPQFARRRRRRRKPREVLDRFDAEPPTWRERARIGLFDRLARLEKFEKDAFKKGLLLAESESPTLAARLMPGRTTYRQEQLELNYVNPILNILAEAGISLPKFEDFLILRTTLESNEDLRRKRLKAETNRRRAREAQSPLAQPHRPHPAGRCARGPEAAASHGPQGGEAAAQGGGLHRSRQGPQVLLHGRRGRGQAGRVGERSAD